MAYRSLKSCFHDPKCDEKCIYDQRIHSDQCICLPLYLTKDVPFFFLVNEDVMNLCWDILLLNAQCERLTERVDDLSVLIYAILLEEIKQSNSIEGISSSKKDLLRSDLDSSLNQATRFSSQLRLYKDLLREKQPFPASPQEIAAIYKEMFLGNPLGIEKKNIPDGRLFRKDQVFVGNSLKTFRQGLYPEDKIIEALEQSLDSLSGHKCLIQAGIFHFLFGYIHPFYDGNGRMDRYLTIRLLSQELSLSGILNFSVVAKKNRNRYYREFELAEDLTNRGDLTPFLIMMLELIKESMNRGIQILAQTSEKLAWAVSVIDEMDISKNKKEFLKLMAKISLYDVVGLNQDEIAKELDCSKPLVQKMIKEFEDDLWRIKDGRVYRYCLHQKFFKLRDR